MLSADDKSLMISCFQKRDISRFSRTKVDLIFMQVHLLSNHRLPVETGRWENTPLEDRKCTLCSKYDIGDEFHYLFVCDHFISDRKKYLRSYFYKSPNIIKFKELFPLANTRKLVKLSSFVEIIMNKFSCAA